MSRITIEFAPGCPLETVDVVTGGDNAEREVQEVLGRYADQGWEFDVRDPGLENRWPASVEWWRRQGDRVRPVGRVGIDLAGAVTLTEDELLDAMGADDPIAEIERRLAWPAWSR